MHYFNDQPSGFKETEESIVEIRLWEAFLLYNRHNLYTTLSTYAVDNGPIEKEVHDMGTVTFRFTAYDWNNTLKRLLASNNIPVIKELRIPKEKVSLYQN
jgi:hypothetical protein